MVHRTAGAQRLGVVASTSLEEFTKARGQRNAQENEQDNEEYEGYEVATFVNQTIAEVW